MKEQIKLYNNMITFIKLVKNKSTIFNLDSNEMIKYLKENKLDTINASYDYLTDMTFKQLSKVNLEKLENKIKELKIDHKKISELTNKAIWLDDLNQLKNIIMK
jgi:hypothetical protein